MTNGLIGGRYEIVETIGKGGMAIVYKAKCQMLNRYVALKVLRPEYREDKDFIRRFKAEAQSAASLSHPNIVSIHDVCHDDDLDYIVMEYVEGVTLKQYIDAQGILPWREAVDYAAQICAGLEHAHKKGIIHKDIKPHNIMITREGTLKITDFGIAKVMSSGTIATGNIAMGSVHYFSPEQARGGYTDHKTDIYSLGVVLYEMLTGKLPFEGDTAIAIAMQHIEKEATLPRELNPDIPESLENVIRRAMSKDQTMRYDSVTQMMIDLKKVYTGSPVTFPPQERPKVEREDNSKKVGTATGKKGKKEKTPEQEKKDKVAVIAGILAGIVIVAGVFLASFFFVSNGDKVQEIELPDFTNMSLSEAQNMVVNSELVIVVDKEVKSTSVSAGKIISQSPKAGDMVKENATIKVVISAGEGDFPMPELVNRKQEDAEKVLTDKNLVFSFVEEPSDTIPEGYVVRQVPEAGTYIDAATSVTVYVSSGKEETTVEVPNMLGLSLNDAKAALLDNNLTWGRIVEADSAKPKGTVISQSIRAKVKVEEKTAIDLRVSNGKNAGSTDPGPVDTPDNPPIVIGPPNAG